jgi:hypothetical protein
MCCMVEAIHNPLEIVAPESYGCICLAKRQDNSRLCVPNFSVQPDFVVDYGAQSQFVS